jgi:hypothetical protein
MQRFLTAAIAALTLAACDSRRPTEATPSTIDESRSGASAAPTIVASGLEYPRGFDFRDGAIYVAEAGTPEGNTTVGPCAEQVPPPVGPWKGGFTGRISRISRSGTRTTVIDHLPSALDALGDVDGISDVAFHGDKLYALSSAGCSRGHQNEPSSVIQVGKRGGYERVANLTQWIKTHPTAHPNPGDFEPDGDWYNMASKGDVLYIVESNQGNLVAVKPNGNERERIRRIADVSATENAHVVPTGLAFSKHGNDLLVGELRGFPAVTGSADVIVYDRKGNVENRLHGFTAITGVAADHHGNVYVMEAFNCVAGTPCFPSPGTGDIVRVKRDGTRDVVVRGLSFPTSVRLGPDAALYFTNFIFGPPHVGEIQRWQP